MGAAEPTCIVMLRAPHLSRVKTRLGKSVGAEEALRIYRRLVEHQLVEVPSSWRIVIQYTPTGAEDKMRDWLGAQLIYRSQQGEDLGERLTAAMDAVFAEGCGPCFVVGGDCPGLNRLVLERAATCLGGSDVVIGPAADGGYTLLGLKEANPDLFRGVAWGTSSVLEQTLAQIAGAGLAVSTLPTLEDVDDIGSWERNRHLLD